MKKILWILLTILLLLLVKPSFADSVYVLPYPSTMPGSYWYKLHLIAEAVQKFWYFGDFGQFYYNVKESDKYLVEAKTLFDYQQYLLADKALRKSGQYYQKINFALMNAKNHGKDITVKKIIVNFSRQKHNEVLTKLENEVPKEILWQPEKAAQTTLHIRKDIDHELVIRNR